MQKICRMSASEITQELKEIGSVCNDEWKAKRAAEWIEERNREWSKKLTSHILAGIVGQLSAIGLK